MVQISSLDGMRAIAVMFVCASLLVSECHRRHDYYTYLAIIALASSWA